MVPSIREQFNANFSEARYQHMLEHLAAQYQETPAFKVAETPVFVPKTLKEKLIEACEQITDVLVQPDFLEKSESAILAGQVVPNETPHTHFLQMDFGICLDENGEMIPQLIEAQGFPSLYFFQHLVASCYQEAYDIPENYQHLFGGLSPDAYIEKLRDIIVGDENPTQVVLLEVEPDKQVTRIDFTIAAQQLGIKVCCVSDLKMEGKDVFYLNESGEKIQVKRIFNRVIFDELIQRDDLQREFYFTKEANVKWIGHPHWFFRISKHTLPLLDSPYVPKSMFLNELEELPEDLDRYVLKPLYSFAGSGVIINLNRFDVESIKDKENYILQRKVKYAPVVETLDVPAKCEIRMLMLWEEGAERPVIVNNLARLSKGEMIGVRYNKNKTWVGGSVGFFEQ
ncbi:MAG: hypothetical protein AAFV80_00825 [Bacteroidota bacterium]